MSLSKDLINKFSYITSMAAAATFAYIGKKDKIAADKAAVDMMRREINKLNINGKIVIGEGELDEAPMLYIGENLGSGQGVSLDIAVDPVEGTNLVANNLPGGLSVIAVAEKDNLFNAPETYMNKIAFGKDVPKSALDLDFSIEKNIKNLADVKNKDIKDITACLLDRPRHNELIRELNKLNVNLKLITDGDVSGALLVTEEKHNVDIFLGIGGGPEGVLAASALDAYGCNFQGRLIFEKEDEISRAKKMGISDLKRKYEINEIIRGDSIFCATGITDGDLVKGVKKMDEHYLTETLVTHKNSNIDIIKNKVTIA